MSGPLTVLIVNDNEDKANIWLPRDFRKIDSNLTIISATDAVTAMDMIAEHQPDVLFCDVCLPHSESNQTLATGREYIHSRKVVEAFTKAKPDGAIILDSPYADTYKDFYPDKATLLGPAIGDDEEGKRLETIRKVVDAQKHRKDDSALPTLAESHGENPIAKEPSRIVQVRRSPWHNGSRAADEESWSIKTSPLSTSSTPKLER